MCPYALRSLAFFLYITKLKKTAETVFLLFYVYLLI